MQKSQYRRNNRLLKQKNNDVYLEKSKISDPTLCSTCGSLYLKGRWTWDKPTESIHKSTCPACKRIADNYPAGIIKLRGTFFSEHRKELLNLVKNVEEQEKKEHALERIIAIKKESGFTIITTTGIHLGRRIGEALSRSYKGDLSYQYLDSEKGIRVTWAR